MRGLFPRVFRPLATPLGGVDDQPGALPRGCLALAKVTGVSLGEDAQLVQGLPQDGEQPVDPVVHPRLAQAKEFTQDNLEGVGLEID